MSPNILFYILALLILGTAGLVAFRPRPIESALWLILNFFFTAALYVLLGSHFVAVIQVLVYAGAIMVLFVFVILLLNLDPKELGMEASLPWTTIVLFLGAVTFVSLCLRISTPQIMSALPPIDPQANFGTVESISRRLVTEYVWSFELSGVILLLAIVGVGLLAYRRPRIRKTSEGRLA